MPCRIVACLGPCSQLDVGLVLPALLHLRREAPALRRRTWRLTVQLLPFHCQHICPVAQLLSASSSLSSFYFDPDIHR